MLSYAQWDMIADAYIPLLFFFVFIFFIAFRHRSLIYKQFLYMVCAVVGVYVLYGFDRILNVWPMFDLDYSTHTALSYALVCVSMFLVCCYWTGMQRYCALVFIGFSFIGYLVLMHFQGYHTYADMFSTFLCITTMLLILYFILLRQRCC